MTLKLYDLEKHIMDAWLTADDIDTVLWKFSDCEDIPTEDDVANLLIGLSSIHKVRMEKLFQAYSNLLKTQHSGIY